MNLLDRKWTTAALINWVLSAAAFCCQKERQFHAGPKALSKRAADLPPSLDPNESVLVSSFEDTTISEWSYYYTHGLDVAGTNQSMAQWTADKWTSYGISAQLSSYTLYLNYPVSHSLSLTSPDGCVFSSSLAEAALPSDKTTTHTNRVPTFHGYYSTCNATAEDIYVDRGQQADFARLQELNVPLEGRIALARYGGPSRGLKVKNTQEHGVIGCIIFTDTGDNGNITEANGYGVYPDGPARNLTSKGG